MTLAMPVLYDGHGRPALSDAARAAALPPDLGTNAPNSVADVHVPFPVEWMARLRDISPVSETHSFLIPYWYRARERWVLYDAVPRALIHEDEPQAPGLMGFELIALLEGAPPREKPAFLAQPFVSDAQHEMYRVHRAYARPFWVLQGDAGGHQVQYSPEQKDFLTRVGLGLKPPVIGELAPCPFDNRVEAQLRRLNRLYALNGSLAKLRASGSRDAAESTQAATEKEIRRLSMDMLEQQLASVGEMVHALGKRSETQDALIHRTGEAAKAKDAIAVYIETGEFVM